MAFDETDESFTTSVEAIEDVNVIDYQYDANGNRTATNNRNYEYAVNSNQIVKDKNIDITMDAVGNTLNIRGDRTFTYNDTGRLRTVSKAGVLKATYRYNSLGQRTRKEIPGKNSQVFHYDINGNLILRTRGDSKPVEDYIWVDGELVQFTKLKGKAIDGQMTGVNAKTFISNDHLSTPRLGTNDAQVITWEWVADAFNRVRPEKDPDADGKKVNLKIGFPGQYWDAESGLYYNWNRYYDRQIGRYVTSDPIGLDSGVNTFGYVDGNPLNSYDFRGLRKGPFGPKCGPEGSITATFIPDISPNACDEHDRCWEECARRCAGKNCKTICDWKFTFRNPVYGLAVSGGGDQVYEDLERKFGCESGMCGTANP